MVPANEGSGTNKRSMRLLVDTKAQRVLYAQAGKDVADFFFSIRVMPPWSRSSMARAVLQLRSVDNLDPAFIWRSINRGITEIGVGAVPVTYCSACQQSKSTTTAPCAAGDGCVQQAGNVAYTIMDDLEVAPMAAVSGITLFKADIGSLQEMTVELGHAEALEILKASLQSKTVLTDVFLRKKRNGWKLPLFFRCLLVIVVACLLHDAMSGVPS